MSTVEHPRIRPGTIEDRLYQAHIAATAENANTLVVLPTGLGKTAIALRVTAESLLRAPTKSVLWLAPTRPLVVQHGRELERTLLAPPPLVLTGALSPDRRAALLHPPQLVVATPQVVANDLEHGEFPLGSFALMVVDEAHRAVGEYPYVTLGRAARDLGLRVLAMTASPGSRIERIRAVWSNLGVDRFEMRGAEDPDVAPYTHGISVEPITVPVPAEVRHLGILLRNALQRPAETLRRLGVLPTGEMTRRELLELGQRLRRQTETARARSEPAPAHVWTAVTAQAAAMKLLHAVELIETQGVEALRQYLGRQARDPRRTRSPALRAFLDDPDVQQTVRILEQLNVEHPKFAFAVDLVAAELRTSPGSRVILFAHYRQTAEQLVAEFTRRPESGVRAVRFVGQASRPGDEGLSQKEQVEILEKFRRGEVNCLVATSVAEEGLDVPATDLVVLYEPVPDEIRTIQRRGRTGRTRTGRAVVLIAEGTRDLGMYRAAQAKERRMHEMLSRVEAEARRGPLAAPPSAKSVQTILSEFN